LHDLLTRVKHELCGWRWLRLGSIRPLTHSPTSSICRDRARGAYPGRAPRFMRKLQIIERNSFYLQRVIHFSRYSITWLTQSLSMLVFLCIERDGLENLPGKRHFVLRLASREHAQGHTAIQFDMDLGRIWEAFVKLALRISDSRVLAVNL